MPYNKLKVFISSPMRPEGGIDWEGIRSSVDGTLSCDSQFDVFAIEDHASTEPSIQKMIATVDQSNIIVLLIGNELRPGTETEVNRAFEKERPLLVYALKSDGREEKVSRLIDKIKDKDCRTLKEVNSFEGIADAIIDDLKSDLTDAFIHQGASKPMDSALGGPTFPHNLPASTLSVFGDACTLLCKEYKRSVYYTSVDNPYLQPLGSRAIRWLLHGGELNLGSYSSTLSLAVGDDFQELLPVLVHRWDAVTAYTSGDKKVAEDEIREALDSYHTTSDWLYANMLIDQRNLIPCYGERHAEWATVQDKLVGCLGPGTFPLGAYFLSEATDAVQEGEDAKWLDRGSLVYGENRLATALVGISNYAFSSIIYGSITHLEESRTELAKLLLRFGLMYQNGGIYFEGLRLLLLSGWFKELDGWLENGWDIASNEIASGAAELWETTSGVATDARLEARCIVLKHLGGYMDNPLFEQATNVLLSSEPTTLNERTRRTEAIANNSMRIPSGKLATATSELVDKRWYSTAQPLNLLLGNYRPADSTDGENRQLLVSLTENVDSLLKSGFEPATLATLACKDASFSRVAALAGEKAVGYSSKVFDFATNDEKDTASLFKAAVEEADGQYEANNDASCFTTSAYRPADAICEILSREQYETLGEEDRSGLLRLLEKLPDSVACLRALDPYLRCAVVLASVCLKDGRSVCPTLADVSTKLGKLDDRQVGGLPGEYSKATWETRLQTLRFLVGTIGRPQYELWLVIHASGSRDTKRALADSLLAVLRAAMPDCQNTSMVLVQQTLALSQDADSSVRRASVECLAELLGSDVDDVAKGALVALAADDSAEVRNSVLMSMQRMADGEFKNEMLRMLQSDANFFIHTKALKAAKEMDHTALSQ